MQPTWTSLTTKQNLNFKNEKETKTNEKEVEREEEWATSLFCSGDLFQPRIVEIEYTPEEPDWEQLSKLAPLAIKI